jgi:hypothetical protein
MVLCVIGVVPGYKKCFSSEHLRGASGWDDMLNDFKHFYKASSAQSSRHLLVGKSFGSVSRLYGNHRIVVSCKTCCRSKVFLASRRCGLTEVPALMSDPVHFSCDRQSDP